MQTSHRILWARGARSSPMGDATMLGVELFSSQWTDFNQGSVDEQRLIPPLTVGICRAAFTYFRVIKVAVPRRTARSSKRRRQTRGEECGCRCFAEDAWREARRR